MATSRMNASASVLDSKEASGVEGIDAAEEAR